jgi:hypothetical protein
MRESYLPKIAVAILIVAAAFVIVSGQSVHVAASPSSPQWNCYYSYTNSSYYWEYPYYDYYYGSPYYDSCSYSYSYYPYYSYYYPYSYSYSYYPYYGYNNGYNNYGYNYGYMYGYSMPAQYKLTVATDPSTLGTASGSGTYNQGTSASFSVTQTVVQTSPNTRYMFSHWSGDYSGVGSSGTITVNGATKITAVYQLQYYLTVNAQPQSVPSPQGSGWYNAGDTATVNTPGQTIGGDSQSRLVMQGWSIDGQNAQPTAALSVKMDAPHSVTAVYGQQYYLTVQSDQGAATGQGWYDAGSTAQIYASTPPSPSYGVSYVFNGWQGDVQSNSQSASVLMDKAKTATATWRTDSTVLYATIGLVLVAIILAAGIIGLAVRGRPRTYVVPAQSTHTSETTTTTKTDGQTTQHKKKSAEPQQ